MTNAASGTTSATVATAYHRNAARQPERAMSWVASGGIARPDSDTPTAAMPIAMPRRAENQRDTSATGAIAPIAAVPAPTSRPKAA